MQNETLSSAERDAGDRVDELLATARPLDGRDPALGLKLSEEARDLAARAGDEARVAACDLSVGTFAWRLGDFDRAIAHLTAALAHFDATGDARGQARCHGNLGNVHYSRARHADALRHYLEALRLSRETNDEQLEVVALSATGSVYEDLGDYATALAYRLRTLRHAERVGNEAAMAAPLTNLGNTYQRRRQFGDAVQSYERARAVAAASGNTRNAMMASLNLGSALTELGQFAAAVTAFTEAHELAERLNARTTQVWAIAGLLRARAGLDANDAERDARDDYRRARAVAASLDAPDCAIGLDRAFGEVLARAGRVDEAHEVLVAALRRAEAHDLPAARRDLHELLAGTLERRGDLRGALEHLRAFHALERRLHGETQEQRALAVAVQHQLEQAQAEARAARAANEALVRKNAELVALDAERAALLRRLREQADRDDLTGLDNRRAFRASLNAALDANPAAGAPGIAVVLADVDAFKGINDRFSHAVGDAVLRELAAVLRGACRSLDVIARYGGEEFALLLRGVDAGSAFGAVERARAAVERHDWSRIAPDLRVTMSFGVCVDAGTDGLDAWLNAADERLYAAKRDGRNLVR